MAWYSRLYVVDELPTPEEPGAWPVSEWKWDIPIIHELLVSNRPRLCPSEFFDWKELAIYGERAGVYELLFTFLRTLAASGPLVEPELFADALKDAQAFLAKPQVQGKYMLLEPGDIFAAIEGVGDRMVVETTTLLTDLIPYTRELVEGAIAGGERKWLEELRADWPNKLGLEGWAFDEYEFLDVEG